MLSDQPERPTVLFIHHPPFDIDDHYVGGYRRPEEASALAGVVSRHPQVKGLLCGHVHCVTERPWSGTVGRVMSSIAVDVRKDAGETVASGPLYLLHRVSGESGVVSRIRRVRDTC